MQLIAGLGNPGEAYSDSPHNIGFRTLDKLLDQLGLKGFQKRFQSEFQKFSENGNTTLLLKPGIFMNRSGEPIAECASFFKIPPERILVICDDLDLPAGMARLRVSGGHGGHNGLRSIIENLGSENILRARVGIGRPELGKHVTGYVLGKMEESKERLCAMSIEKVVEALIWFVQDSSFQSTSLSIPALSEKSQANMENGN